MSLPSALGIYVRAALGGVYKQRSLSPDTKLLSLPSERFAISIDPAHVEAYLQTVGGSAPDGSTLPLGYLQCYLNALPMNHLTSPGFPLNVIGSVHEKTEIQSLRNVKASESLLATSRMLPEIERSDKGDWLFSHETEIESEGQAVMLLRNTFRVFNPERNKVQVEPKSGQPAVDYQAEDSGFTNVGQFDFPLDTGRRYERSNGRAPSERMCEREHVRASTCASEHVRERAHLRPRRPQGGFGGSPPDNHRAAEKRRRTAASRSPVSECSASPALRWEGSGGLPPPAPSLARFCRRRTLLRCARFARAPSSPLACPLLPQKSSGSSSDTL
jgi:hypothetical protein